MTIYYFYKKKWFNSIELHQKFKVLNLALLLLFMLGSANNLFSQCDMDADCDLILNNVDLDDDNDGILDTDENNCGNQPIAISSEDINNSLNQVTLHDGSSTPQTIFATFPIPGCDDNTEEIQYTVTAFPSTASGSNQICADVQAFTAFPSVINDFIALDKPNGCVGGVTYRIDFVSGNEILNLSSITHANMASDEAIIIRSNVPLSVNTFKKPNETNIPGSNGGPMVTGANTMEVKIDNVSGGFGGNRNVWEVSSNGLAVPFVEIEYYRSTGNDGASFEAFSLFHVSGCDTDCDGTPDQFDLDSDDDGCADAVEAGAMDSDEDGILGTSPIMVDDNGLVIGQGGYNGTNNSVTDDELNVCNPCISNPEDSDGDGICDALDLDDDNDGILDTDENNCGNQPIAIASEDINNSLNQVTLHDGSSTPQTIFATFPIAGCDDDTEEVQYTVTAFPSTASGSNQICADVQAFTAFPSVINDFIALDKPNGCVGGVTYRIDFVSGNEILNLSSITHANMASDEAIIIRSSVPLSVNTFKKPNETNIPGSNGGPMVTGANTMEVKIDNVSGGFGGNRNVWEVSSNGLSVPFVEIEYYRSTGNDGASFEAFSLFHVSGCDTDCDGILDRFDPDSDNDGCADAIEAGAMDADEDGILGTSPVMVDENGLVIGQGGYNGTNSSVIDDELNVCNPCISNPQDSDGDGICDILDLDDDNDGILDTDENNCGNQPTAIASEDINNSLDQVALHDGSSTPQTIFATFPIPGCDNDTEEVQYTVTAFASTASGSDQICADVQAFTAFPSVINDFIALDKPNGCVGGVTYRIEFVSGNEVLNLSSITHANMASDEAIIIRSSVPLSVNTFKKPNETNIPGSNGGPVVTGANTMEVKIDNVSGGFGGNRNVWEVSSNGFAVPFVEIEYYRSTGNDGASFEAFSLFHASGCDTDCDGTPDQFDLDSDDDGCFDAVEAGATDADEDGILGTSPVMVDENGLVIGQGGYNGTDNSVIDPTVTNNCMTCEPLTLDNINRVRGDCGQDNAAIYLSIENRDFPHTFEWSNGYDEEDLLNASPGQYSMTLTDATGCTSVYGPFTIADPCEDTPCIFKPQLDDVEIIPADCEQENGSIDITVSGGNPPFEYFWTDGFATTEDLTGLAPDVYGVVVTDAVGCSVKFAQLVVEEDCSSDCIAPTLDQVNISAGSCGNDDAGIYLSIENVNLPHTFIWNNGTTTEDLLAVADGATYSMTLTDNKGCEFEYGPFTIPPACQGFSNGTGANNTPFSVNDGFKIFPNPISNNQELNLEFRTDAEEVSFRLINTLGQVVKTFNYQISSSLLQTQLDISALNPGIYYLASDDNQYQKFIVK